MTPAALIAELEAGMARERQNPSEADLVFTFVSPTATGLGIRPTILQRHADGTYVLGVTRAVAKRWVKRLREVGA